MTEKSLKERLELVRANLHAIVSKFNKDIADFEYYTGLKANLDTSVQTGRVIIRSIELQKPTFDKVK